MEYCQKCVYPLVTVNLHVDDDGICSSCRSSDDFGGLSGQFWEMRKGKFEQIIAEHVQSNTSNYDCLIPVSGGKDSYYQAHIIAAEYGLKPLLMT